MSIIQEKKFMWTVNYYQNGLQIEIVYCMILTVSGSFLERSLYGKIIKIVECKGQRKL